MPKEMHTVESKDERRNRLSREIAQRKADARFKEWVNAVGRQFQKDFDNNNTPLFDALMADRGRDRYGNDLPE